MTSLPTTCADRDAEDGVHGVCRAAVLPGRQVSGKARRHARLHWRRVLLLPPSSYRPSFRLLVGNWDLNQHPVADAHQSVKLGETNAFISSASLTWVSLQPEDSSDALTDWLAEATPTSRLGPGEHQDWDDCSSQQPFPPSVD